MKNLSDKEMVVTNLTEMRTRKESLKVSGEDLLLFTQELGSMLKAGILLSKALNVLASDVENSSLRQIALELDAGINSGKTLTECLKQYPKVFDKLYVSMVEAGEGGGELPLILLRLAKYIEQSEILKKKIISQLYYPAMTLVFAMLVMLFILSYGIPIVVSVYSGFDTELPLLTQLVLVFGKFMQSYWHALIVVLAVLVVALIHLLNTEKGAYYFDKLMLEIRVIGPLVKKMAIARFARTLGTLYGAGVPILHAMELTAGGIGNRVMEKLLRKSLENISEGSSVTQALGKVKVFTPMAMSMMAAGEETGSLDVMLNELAEFYETQVEISVRALTSLLEPIIMIFVGMFVAVIILALALPFMQLFTVLK
jgi:type IV pilus assembly protein PilC